MPKATRPIEPVVGPVDNQYSSPVAIGTSRDAAARGALVSGRLTIGSVLPQTRPSPGGPSLRSATARVPYDGRLLNVLRTTVGLRHSRRSAHLLSVLHLGLR